MRKDNVFLLLYVWEESQEFSVVLLPALLQAGARNLGCADLVQHQKIPQPYAFHAIVSAHWIIKTSAGACKQLPTSVDSLGTNTDLKFSGEIMIPIANLNETY